MGDELRTIRRHLPLHIKRPQRFWALAGEACRPMVEPVDAFLANGAPRQDVERLKRGPRREIVRLRSRHLQGGSVVVKAYPLRSVRKRLLRWRRYGPREAANLLTARERSLPVPRLLAYGHQRRFGCFVPRTWIVQEDLASMEPLTGLVHRHRGCPGAVSHLLSQVGSLLYELYLAGCNHIDLSPQNILGTPQPPFELRVIDLHYARFHARPSETCLAFNMGYLARSLPNRALASEMDAVASEIASNLPEPEAFLTRYAGFKARELSRAERLSLA